MGNARICLICVVLAVIPCAARTITVDDDGPAEIIDHRQSRWYEEGP